MDKKMIQNLVDAFELKQGEVVLFQFWGEDGMLDILHDFSYAAAAAGAIPMEVQHSRTYYRHLFEYLKEGFPEKYFNQFKEADTVIDLLQYAPVQWAEDFPKEKLGDYKSYMKRLFQCLAEKEKFIQLRLPSRENAEEAGWEEREYCVKMTEAYSVDYGLLKKKAGKLMEQLKDTAFIRIVTGDCKSLELNVRGRAWYEDTGTGDMPCGEIYIAPVEYEAEGSLYFEKMILEEICEEAVTIHFSKGKITGADNHGAKEYLAEKREEELLLSEFGIGLNNQIKQLTGYGLLDEKMAGTFHIGTGMNCMFGGKISGGIHRDYVFKGRAEFRNAAGDILLVL